MGVAASKFVKLNSQTALKTKIPPSCSTAVLYGYEHLQVAAPGKQEIPCYFSYAIYLLCLCATLLKSAIFQTLLCI